MAEREIYKNIEKVARDFASDFVRYFTRYFARDFASYFASYFVRDFVRPFARDFASDFALHFKRDFVSNFAGDFVRDFPRYFASYFARVFPRNLASNFASYFVREAGISPDSSGLMDFAKCELMAVGRTGARFALAVLEPHREEGIAKLLCLAARLSGQPDSDGTPFEHVLAEIGPTLHPIWPALAKHITRRSTPADRALLLDYAEHPEKAGEPLCWGLQFIVRGDVMREDGSIVTLDEISAAAGLKPLPLLEDMPPELEF